MKKLIFLLIFGIFLINLGSLAYAACSGGADLDINKISLSPNNTLFKVVATANGNGDCLNIAWTKDDINNLLSQSYPETITNQSITGDVQLTEQKDTFHTSVNNADTIYSYNIGDAGWAPLSCNANTCSNKGYSSSDYYILNTIGECYCVYKNQPIATFGTFNGIGDRNGKAIISFSGLSPMQINYGQSDGTQSNDKVTVSWRGDLLAGHSITAPNYNVYMDNNGFFHLISQSSNYQTVKNSQIDNNGNSLSNCLGSSSGYRLIGGISQAQSCINLYSSALIPLLNDQLQNYVGSAGGSVKSASFEGSNLVVNETPYSASYPQFTLTFNAAWAGIHWVTGQPKVTCPSDSSLISGDNKTLSFSVKNTANENGAFSLALDCGDVSSTLSNNKLLLNQGNSTSVSATLTASTNISKKIVCTFRAYPTRDSSKTDQCSFNVKIEPLPSTIIKNTNKAITSAFSQSSISKSSSRTATLIIFLILITGSTGFFIYTKIKKKVIKKGKKFILETIVSMWNGPDGI